MKPPFVLNLLTNTFIIKKGLENMNYKVLISIFLSITTKLWSAEVYEVRIVFASNPFSHHFNKIFLSNERTPVIRVFKNKLDAYKFVKLLNQINEQEPTGLNKIIALKRAIALSEKEETALRATTFETADGIKRFIGGYLIRPTNIYVQQIRPVRPAAEAATTLPAIKSAFKPIGKA